MARPIKQGVDYFPHQVNTGKTLYILEKNFGNDGYAVWFKTLELLGQKSGLYLDLNNVADWEFYVAKMNVENDTAKSILDNLADLEAIDKLLWKNKVIWCQNFVNGLSDVYAKRKVSVPIMPVFDPKKGVIATKTPVIDPVSTQSKVKESKVDKTKEKESKLSSSQKQAKEDFDPKEDIEKKLGLPIRDFVKGAQK